MPALDRPTTLTAEAISYIRDAVIRGQFEANAPLPEIKLAEDLQTSRVTIRVALRALAEQGLVDIVPYRGAFVSELTTKTAREIFSLRAVLESYAVRLALAAGPYSNEALEQLEDSLIRIEAAQDDEDPFSVIDAVVEFHWLIAAQCNHDLLLSVLENLQPQVRRLVFYTKVYESDELTEFEGHRQLIDAIRAGDPDHGAGIVFAHVSGSGERLVAVMEASTAESK